MIEYARNALSELGLAPHDANLVCNATLQHRVSYDVFVDPGVFYRVKLSSESETQAEYLAMRTAREVLGPALPEPIGVVHAGPWSALVCRGVWHDIVTWQSARKRHRVLEAFFAHYFRCSTSAWRQRKDGTAVSARIAGYLPGLANAPLQARLVAALKGPTGAILDRLPKVSQHCDFYRGNLGFAEGRVMVFDWEDFGASTLPALDISVFLVSLLGFEPARVEGLLRNGEPRFLDDLIGLFCAAYGLGRADFVHILPLSLLEFFHLKCDRNYNDAIAQSVHTVINHCMRESTGHGL